MRLLPLESAGPDASCVKKIKAGRDGKSLSPRGGSRIVGAMWLRIAIACTGIGLLAACGGQDTSGSTSSGGSGGATAGAGGTSSSTGGTTSMSTGGTSSTSTSGCVPGVTVSCYTGPAGTQGIGLCKAGMQACAADGSGFLDCVGEIVPSAENCAAPEDEDCNGIAPACGGDLIAKHEVGLSGAGANAEVFGMAFDGSDALFATGIFTGGMDFGSGPLTSAGDTDIFAVAFDTATVATGGIRFGAGGHEEGLSLSTTPEGAFAILGRANQNVDLGVQFLGGTPFTTFVGQFEPSMQIRWARGFSGTAMVYPGTVSVNASGRVTAVAIFEGGTIDVGGGPVTANGTDGFVGVYDGENGDYVWSRILTSPNLERAESVAIDDAGNVFVTGYHDQPWTIDGLTVDGGGRFLLKLNPTGQAVFLKVADQANSVVPDQVGGATCAGGAGVFHFDAQGNKTWSHPGLYARVARDPFGNYVAANTTVLKLDPQGNVLFENPVDLSVVRDVAVDSMGRIAITGRDDVANIQSTIEWFTP